MKFSFKGLSNTQKFFITLTAIFVIAILDYRSFVGKSEKIELYDGLHMEISSARVLISKLESTLDLFVLSRNFEGTSVSLIKKDLEKIDELIKDAFWSQRYSGLLENNTVLSQEMAAISDDWHTIEDEIKRMHEAMTQDEIILIHNAVDMNTILITDRADRLLGVIEESRKEAFAATKALALKSIVGFVLITLFASLVYHKKVLSPITKASRVMARVRSGELGARFREDGRSVMGRFAGELNAMLEGLVLMLRGKEAERADISGELARKSSQLQALTDVMGFAACSLSQNEVFERAAKAAVFEGGADGASVYLKEDGKLRLKAYAGFDDNFVKEASVLEEAVEAGSQAQCFFASIDMLPSESYRDLLNSSGFKALLSIPVVYGGEVIGVVNAAFREGAEAARHEAFIKALSSGLAVSSGHAGLFQREHNSRKSLERLINQVPFGLGVFDRSGVCTLANANLRRIFGVDPKTNVVGEYSVFDDAVLASHGMATSIKKSYEGYATEFIITYNPALSGRPGFNGQARRLKVRSFPLFDSGGEISNIVLLYEELAEWAQTAGPGEAL